MCAIQIEKNKQSEMTNKPLTHADGIADSVIMCDSVLNENSRLPKGTRAAADAAVYDEGLCNSNVSTLF